MKIVVITPLGGFANDIADVVRLFYGEGAAVRPGEPCDARLVHEHALHDGVWYESFRLLGEGAPKVLTMSEKAVIDGLEEKRRLKRLIKRCCYGLLRDHTGMRPAWGSLTGIRPTRLYYQQLEAGMSRARARAFLAEQFDLSQDKLKLLDEVLDAQMGYVQRDPQVCDLYIGIPFCTTRCAYCSFSSGELGDGHLVEPYLEALFREIDACARLSRELGFRVRAGYLGGGTPTSLTTSQLNRLLLHVEKCFGAFPELTVEAGRPDTLDREKLSMLRMHPVTRISINPQTMNDETLVRIGRAHTAGQTAEMYALSRTLGFDNINMDVIAALPGEDTDLFAHTLERVQEMSPDSLTVHTLAIKRSSRLHEQGYRPCEADVADMVAMGRDAAHSMGMHAYYLYRQKYMAQNMENVGYARDDCVCRYNIDNMEETTSVLAMGAGAISKCVLSGEERILRAPNVSNIEQYICRVDEMIDRKRRAFSQTAQL